MTGKIANSRILTSNNNINEKVVLTGKEHLCVIIVNDNRQSSKPKIPNMFFLSQQRHEILRVMFL